MFQFKVDDEIELRLLQPSHAKVLFSLVDENRSYLRQWLPWLDANIAVSDSLQFIESSQKQWIDKSGLVAGIWYRGELVGLIGYNRIDWENRTAYIGYWLDAKHQKRGIMTRSCRALIDYAFDELQLNRVDIRCAVENHSSRAIPKRLDFRQEGIIREAEWLYDKFVDHIVYGLISSEWHG